ncbi:MAG: prepilin peptidase [Vulcanimicrobiaceae bacterium]
MIDAFIVASWTAVLWILAMNCARRRDLLFPAAATRWAVAAAFGTACLAAMPYAELYVCIGLSAIAVAAVVDAQSGYIFDPLILAGVIGVVATATLEQNAVESIYGAIVAGGTVLCIWAASLGRGLGLGDVKLAVVLGAVFGPLGGIAAIGLAFMAGAAVATCRIIVGKANFGTSIRFGPYLLAGSVCLLAYNRMSDGVLR